MSKQAAEPSASGPEKYSPSKAHIPDVDEGELQGAVRPGAGIYARRKTKRENNTLFKIAGKRMNKYQREILEYSIMIVLFSLGWFMDRPGQDAFLLAERVREKVMLAETTNDLGWHDITSIEDLWEWLTDPFLRVVYNEDTPQSGVGNILGYNGIMYGIRLRQKRVKVALCNQSPQWAFNAIKQLGGFDGSCYPAYSSWNQDKLPYGDDPNDASLKLFQFSEGDKWSQDYSTRYGTYGGGGYYLDLPTFNKTRAREQLLINREFSWLDLQTRAVFIETMLFNPNLKLAVSFRLLAEMPDYGGVITTSEFLTVRISRYVGLFGFIHIVCEALYVILLLRFLFIELLACRDLQVEYIKNVWGMLIIVKAALTFTVIGIRLTAIRSEAENANRGVLNDQEQYVDLQHLPSLYQDDANIMAVLSVLLYARLLKYVAHAPGVEHLFKVLVKSFAEIIPFMVLFSVIFIGYALAFYSLFGLHVYEYRNLMNTFASNILIIMGNSDFYPDMLEANVHMAPLMYYSLLSTFYVLVLNMLNAIVVQTHISMKAELTKDPDVFYREKLQQMLDTFKTGKSQVHNTSMEEKGPGGEQEPLVLHSEASSDLGPRSGANLDVSGSRRRSSLGASLSRPRSRQGSLATPEARRESRELSRRGSTMPLERRHSHADSVGDGVPLDDGLLEAELGDAHMNLVANQVTMTEIADQVAEVRQRVTSVDEMRTQLMSVSDRLNALTEYLLSEPSSKVAHQFQAVSRKLDMLAEALVASNVSHDEDDIEQKVREVSAELRADPTLAGPKHDGETSTKIPGWTD